MIADDTLSLGPVRIERFGRFIRYSNTATPGEHAALLKRAEEAHKWAIAELEKGLPALQKLIEKYDPVELMHRATYKLIPLFMRYVSEIDYPIDESYYLPTVEYLQYLIARTPPNTDGKEPSEEEWNELWDKAIEILHLTQTYLITRKTLTRPPTAIDDLRFILDGKRLGIRGDRYAFFFPDHLRSALEPYEHWIKRAYEITVGDLINALLKIDEYLRVGVIGRYDDVMRSSFELQAKLRERGYAVDPGASEEEMRETRIALESEEFKHLHTDALEKARLTFTPAIFDITDLTTLPKSMLSFLSVKPGESILTSLTGPDHDDLSPLSTSTLHYKPFLEVNGRFYTSYHSGFEDRIAELIEDDLFQKWPDDVPVMAKRRSDRLEIDSADLLASLVKPDFIFRNVFYTNPDPVGGLAELDILLGVDDILFLVEIKAGGFSEAATRGAPKQIEKELSDLIIEGQRQSERAERYIRSGKDVPFFDETGKNIICTIKPAQFRKIFRVVITRENLGWAGAQIAILSILDPRLSSAIPWHVSLDDLRVVVELFKDNELRFVHFLEQRLQASSETTLSQKDEIDHIGLYNKMNSYHEPLVQGMDRITYDGSYIQDIDKYFREKSAGETPETPTQAIPPRMKNLVNALRDSHLAGRFEAASFILSMGDESRNEFEQALEGLDESRVQGKLMSFRMSFTSERHGLTVTYAAGPNWAEEIVRSAVQMEQGGCQRWAVLQLANAAASVVTKIEIVFPGRLSETELLPGRSYLEQRTRRAIVEERPGRNDKCPCGSGRKFKKCHGA